MSQTINDFPIFIVTLIVNTYMNYYIFTLDPLIPCNPGKPGGPVDPLKCT